MPDRLFHACRGRAEKELAAVRAFAAAHGLQGDLQPWDVTGALADPINPPIKPHESMACNVVDISSVPLLQTWHQSTHPPTSIF